MRMWGGNNCHELRKMGWHSIVINMRSTFISDRIDDLMAFLDSERSGRWYAHMFVNPDENEYYFEDEHTAVEFALRFK